MQNLQKTSFSKFTSSKRFALERFALERFTLEQFTLAPLPLLICAIWPQVSSAEGIAGRSYTPDRTVLMPQEIAPPVLVAPYPRQVLAAAQASNALDAMPLALATKTETTPPTQQNNPTTYLSAKAQTNHGDEAGAPAAPYWAAPAAPIAPMPINMPLPANAPVGMPQQPMPAAQMAPQPVPTMPFAFFPMFQGFRPVQAGSAAMTAPAMMPMTNWPWTNQAWTSQAWTNQPWLNQRQAAQVQAIQPQIMRPLTVQPLTVQPRAMQPQSIQPQSIQPWLGQNVVPSPQPAMPIGTPQAFFPWMMPMRATPVPAPQMPQQAWVPQQAWMPQQYMMARPVQPQPLATQQMMQWPPQAWVMPRPASQPAMQQMPVVQTPMQPGMPSPMPMYGMMPNTMMRPFTTGVTQQSIPNQMYRMMPFTWFMPQTATPLAAATPIQESTAPMLATTATAPPTTANTSIAPSPISAFSSAPPAIESSNMANTSSPSFAPVLPRFFPAAAEAAAPAAAPVFAPPALMPAPAPAPVFPAPTMPTMAAPAMPTARVEPVFSTPPISQPTTPQIAPIKVAIATPRTVLVPCDKGFKKVRSKIKRPQGTIMKTRKTAYDPCK